MHIGISRYRHCFAVDTTARTRSPCARETELAPAARLDGPHPRTTHGPHAVRLFASLLCSRAYRGNSILQRLLRLADPPYAALLEEWVF
jgi:hypothetical protein